MTPRSLTDHLVREAPLLEASEPVGDAVRRLVDSGLPALPVMEGGKLLGIFGEREFVAALFPGYLKTLSYAGFVPQSLDDAIEKRQSCRQDEVREHTNTEHVDVDEDYSDVQLAEIFLHHRVLIIPVMRGGKVAGVVTRSDFFHAVTERFLADR